MSSGPKSVNPPPNATAPGEAALRASAEGTALESSRTDGVFEHAPGVGRMTGHLGVDVQTVVRYRDVTLATADGRRCVSRHGCRSSASTSQCASAASSA